MSFGRWNAVATLALLPSVFTSGKDFHFSPKIAPHHFAGEPS
jgi:hypothetical protein